MKWVSISSIQQQVRELGKEKMADVLLDLIWFGEAEGAGLHKELHRQALFAANSPIFYLYLQC